MPLVYLQYDDWNSGYLDGAVLDAVRKMIDYFPDFKVNMMVSMGLVIPPNFYPTQVRYCMHGYSHKYNEDVEEKYLETWPYDKVYLAPYWELPKGMYEKLRKYDFKVCLKPEDCREGIKYNWDIREKPPKKDILIGHGHITKSANNIVDCLSNVLSLPKDTRFGFFREL